MAIPHFQIRSQFIYQVKTLKDKTDIFLAEIAQLALAHSGHFYFIDKIFEGFPMS